MIPRGTEGRRPKIALVDRSTIFRLVQNFFSSTNFSPKLVANVFYARIEYVCDQFRWKFVVEKCYGPNENLVHSEGRKYHHPWSPLGTRLPYSRRRLWYGDRLPEQLARNAKWYHRGTLLSPLSPAHAQVTSQARNVQNVIPLVHPHPRRKRI